MLFFINSALGACPRQVRYSRSPELLHLPARLLGVRRGEYVGYLSALGSHGIVQKVLISEADAVFEFGLIGPAERGGFRHIE